MMKTETTILVEAMQILARDIHSADGVASSAIQEAADRLLEQHEKILKTESERDALQARIDGGLRVKAVYYRGSYDCRRYASEIGHNATLIPDEGVKL